MKSIVLCPSIPYSELLREETPLRPPPVSKTASKKHNTLSKYSKKKYATLVMYRYSKDTKDGVHDSFQLPCIENKKRTGSTEAKSLLSEMPMVPRKNYDILTNNRIVSKDGRRTGGLNARPRILYRTGNKFFKGLC